jgi:hypothetical protein
MEEKPCNSATLVRRIFELEREIDEWRYHNSQSNPGAVMELRSMKKELTTLQSAWRAILDDDKKPVAKDKG